MGVAMRSGEPLALDIHSSVWHALVGGTVIHPVDEQTADAFVSNKAIASSYICASQGAYNPDDDFWFELVPLAGGDALVPVNNSMTCSEYQQELLRFASEEVAAAVECVRQGLLAVVPAASLFSLSWLQLQANVCGSSSFTFNDLEPFLVRTENGISDAAFAILKSVLKSFTPQELSMFLRFCTGLLRLPTDAKSRDGFSIMIRHVIASSARSGRAVPANPDGSVHAVARLFSARFQFDSCSCSRLPAAQTCMRTMDWPEYSGEAVYVFRRFPYDICIWPLSCLLFTSVLARS